MLRMPGKPKKLTGTSIQIKEVQRTSMNTYRTIKDAHTQANQLTTNKNIVRTPMKQRKTINEPRKNIDEQTLMKSRGMQDHQ